MQKEINNLANVHYHSDGVNIRRELLILQSREAMLQKEKINLIKKN